MANYAPIGDLGFYSGGFGLPEGDYIWKDIQPTLHKGFGKEADRNEGRLGIMLTVVELNNPNGEEHKEFYSMGSNAHKSWVPDPSGKRGIVALANGEGKSLPDSTNWILLLKSLLNSDTTIQPILRDGLLDPLVGLHCHMTPVAPPKERKDFALNSTGEGAAPGQPERKDRNVPIVTEIKDDGKPWEGTGGMPKTAAGGAKKPVVTTSAPKKKAAVVDDEDIKSAAIEAISTVLEANPNGLAKLKLKTTVIPAIEKAHGQEMVEKVSEMFFADDESLNGLLGELGYAIKGAQVKPV